jgi:hypothetical protein
MLSRHSAAQEIKHSWQFTSRLIGPQIFNFERSLSLSPGPQSSLVHLVKFLLEALRTRTYSYNYMLGALSMAPKCLAVF